jgi:hypothetical protein
MLSRSNARRLLAVTTFEAENWGTNLRLSTNGGQLSEEVIRFYALRARQLADCLDFLADHLPTDVTEHPVPTFSRQRPKRRGQDNNTFNISAFSPRRRVS